MPPAAPARCITLQILDSSAVFLPERFRGLRLWRPTGFTQAGSLPHDARTLPPAGGRRQGSDTLVQMEISLKPARSRYLSVRGLRYHLREWGPEGAPKLP